MAIFLGGGAAETVCAMGVDLLQYKNFDVESGAASVSDAQVVLTG